MKIKKSIVIFLTVLATIPTLIPFVTANFVVPASSHISILSPAYSPNKYNHENSTVNLTISASLVKEDFSELPVISFISYSFRWTTTRIPRRFHSNKLRLLCMAPTHHNIHSYNYLGELV
jgi:hypothetical protein